MALVAALVGEQALALALASIAFGAAADLEQLVGEQAMALAVGTVPKAAADVEQLVEQLVVELVAVAVADSAGGR
tara:strand:- start:211 stop:435 length:225 start_codon:yes stop_codon:yes gene_type:complete